LIEMNNIHSLNLRDELTITSDHDGFYAETTHQLFEINILNT